MDMLYIEKQNGDHHLHVPPRARARRSSNTESLYSRHSHKNAKPERPESELEHSWIYALCMRCRVECERESFKISKNES